jgi:BirA family biotin operon repressor/biotin-[acetyl-CoA-carboxylase] ligase
MFGFPHQHFDETDSTNRIALEWADAPHGAIVTANAQSRGRGRLGREWNSPPNRGLYLSLVLRDVDAQALSLRVGLGVALAVEEVTKLAIQIKWPNDLVCRDHKIGGILCDANGEKTVVGIGLNLTHRENELPERPVFPASSLRLLGARELEPDEVLPPLLESLQRALENSNWREDVEARLFGRGEIVRAGEVLGMLRGVDESGALQIQTSQKLENIVAGDVSFL